MTIFPVPPSGPSETVPRLWWAWVPLVITFLQIIKEFFFDHHTLTIFLSEGGPWETAQACLMAAGFVLAVLILKEIPKSAPKYLYGWVALAAIACFYVAGEEVSWGQHLFGWATPEFWAEVNDQQETNLHNTSSWLDQKPRLVLEIGVLTGGLIFPLLYKYKPSVLPALFAPIYPPRFLWLTALLVVGLKIADKTSEALDVILFERVSEVIEFYLYYFVVLYLITLKRRMKSLKTA